MLYSFWSVSSALFYSFWCYGHWNCFLNFIFRLFIANVWRYNWLLSLSPCILKSHWTCVLVLIVLMGSLGFSIYTKLCYLQIEVGLLLSFQSGCLACLSIASLPCLGPPGLCWMEVVRVGALVSSDLTEAAFSFSPSRIVVVVVFLQMSFIRVRMFLSIASLLSVFIKNLYLFLYVAGLILPIFY